ncbi:MAG: CehA/McbA family metallohydrolase [Byssovorax sp.]
MRGARFRGVSSLASALVLAACTRGQERPPTPPPAWAVTPAPGAKPAAPPPLPSFLGQGAITRARSAGEVPLLGHRVDAKPGDWIIENAGSVAVVSAEGKLIDFGGLGGHDEITAIDPIVFVGFDAAHSEIVKIEPIPGTAVLHVERRILEKPITLHEFFGFAGPVLKIETAVAAAAPAAAELAVTLGERVGWGNVPTWAEGHGFASQGGAHTGDFLARESFGVAYALCSDRGRMMSRFSGGDPGFYPSAVTGEETIPIPAEGLSARRVISIAQSPLSLGRAAVTLPCVQGAGLERWPLPPTLPESARIEAARCLPDGKPGAPWARFAAREQEAWLPRGCMHLRFTAPGHAPTPWFAPATAMSQTLPLSGTLRFTVTERGKKAMPARVLVRGIAPTPDPDWGDDPSVGAAVNVVYSDKGVGERELPPGKYQVSIGRGFEYTDVDQEITVAPSAVADVKAELERVVDTRGWISADLHLHAVPSPDAPQLLEDRIRALVAAGVEVGVATDHNAVTDYAPTIRSMGLEREIASVVGDEITTKEPYFGHFNAFPLPSGAPPIPWKGRMPRQIFAAAHAAGPLGEIPIVQVNHPRMGDIGYFDLLHLDREDLPGFFRRAPLADMGFEAIEVFNGDHYNHIDAVDAVLKDWFALLNAGFRFTATGNSDSHKLTYQEAGAPRNFVLVPSDDPAAFDQRAFLDAIRRGRVVVSSGPFVKLEINGQPVGSTIPAGPAKIHVIVDAPPWVTIDRVQIVRRGEVLKEWTGLTRGAGARFLDATLDEPLRKGEWVVAIARGSKAMTYLHRSGALPFGFTNPIWID